ncbi:MAG: hypothetical protein IKX50_00545 [Spirochaetia bacterium]|nr:hypothetical protein [Ruminococcus sp.]MBR5016198.1 hypothetical protein [Spirochaetia bacterium]
MARYEYEMKIDASSNGKKLNKGAIIEVVTESFFKPTVLQIKKAIAEKFGKEFERYHLYFKEK